MAQLSGGHSVVHEFNARAVQAAWTESCNRGELLDGFKKHFRIYVPLVYASNHDTTKEEQMANKYLFRPLEEFLCGTQDSETVFQQLKEKNLPSQICGHVFKPGEPTYSCRDCASDPTCVLCIDCFQNSIHRQHRYRMHTSGGTGYCDCGDVEAWKMEPYCSLHRSGLDQDQQQNPIDMLTTELVNRASAMFLATLTYCVDLLTWEKCTELPEGLEPEDTLEETFHCMLFNDEVHTYDQVITTLQRAIDCTQRQAIDYATIVDREGRSSVRIGNRADCDRAKEIIERNTSRHGSKPLKVLVMYNSVVAHQTFAMKMIQWLQNIISKSDGFRRLFCMLSMQVPKQSDSSCAKAVDMEDEDAPLSLMERVLLADTQLWKVARVQSHQLLMACALMDQECKKLFAGIFTKRYDQLLQDFCKDDHDHDVSVTSLTVQMFTVPSLVGGVWVVSGSVGPHTILNDKEYTVFSYLEIVTYQLKMHYASIMKEFLQDDQKRSVSIARISVQIFTVPSLARSLIVEYDLLNVILRSFLRPCESKKNKDGKLCFDRNDRNPVYKRAWYSLHDLKYALLAKPSSSEEWSDPLRENFLHGVGALLDLLKIMQGMDAVTRQTGQHLEFEPEWEGAFNLQLKLEDDLKLFASWCADDKYILIQAYKQTLDALYQCRDSAKREKSEAAGITVKTVKYDVSSKPVSIHLPLTRFLAALHLHLGKFGLTFNSPELMSSTKKRLEPMELMEAPLRTQVMIAQTQAGMWRRNGFALLNQIFFYNNVRCRGEMYDRDIVMLQIGASLMNPDEFLISLLNKFNLLNWARPEYDVPGGQEDSVRQTVMLAEEFLNLLIIILEERYVPGIGEVTQQDVVKREIIHQLCIAPVTHSELVKALPEDHNNETGVEDVVEEVAVFKKPSPTDKGKYELKEEFYSEYCPYYYHYTKTDQSKSEEAQRKRKKQLDEDQALPPPVPPSLTTQFQPLVNILQSDVMLYIMRVVLTRTAAQRSRSWSEAQFERILYIIGIALHEQRRALDTNNTSFDFIVKAVQENGLLSLLQNLVGSQNVSQDPVKDLLTWVLKQFAEICARKDDSVDMETLESITSGKDHKTEAEKKRKAERAAKRRARVMAQMSKMQRNFIAENADLFENTSTDLKAASSDMDLSESIPTGFPIALGSSRSSAVVMAPIHATCILCQEEQEVTCSGKAMVLAAFVQRSTVLSQSRDKTLEIKEDFDPLYMSSDLSSGTHTSSCGHVMHHDCWQRYYDNVMNKERRRPLRFRHSYSYDVEKMEYLCPLCEGLSNTVIPIVPPLVSMLADFETDVELKYDDWLDGIQKTVQNSIQEAHDKESEEEFPLFQPCPISSITRMMAESVAKNFQLLWEYVYDDASGHFSEGMRDMLTKFARDVYSFGLNVDPDDKNPRVSVMAWSTCAFTIQAIEQVLQADNKSLFGSLPTRQADLLGSLVRFGAVVSQVMSPDQVKQHCVRLLSALIPDELEKRNKDAPCLLDQDLFHYLVTLTMTLPTLYAEQQKSVSTLPTGGLNNKHALQLVMTAHITQLMLSFDEQPQEPMDVEGDAEGHALLRVYNSLREHAGIQTEQSPSPYQLHQYIHRAALPFLRCAGILFHHITGVIAPEELYIDGKTTHEFEILCRYLALPVHMSELFEKQGNVTTTLIKSWCCSRNLKERLSASSVKLISYPLNVNKLVTLPKDFSELINQVSTFTCPKSDGDDSRAPTMCLVCGRMLCSQSYCCQTDLDGLSVGAATEHAAQCGAGIGIFLRVRDCQILLLAGKTKGCFIAPPYLDNYGETDQGLRRGNPLHLCEEKYQELQKLWFSHAIPETIAHNLEFNTSFTAIEWQNL